jgi:nitrate reductase NapE component
LILAGGALNNKTQMDTFGLIALYLFPVGIVLIVGAGMFDNKHTTNPICGYVSFAGIAFVLGPIIAGVPFVLYEFFLRPMALLFGVESPSFLQ